MSAVSSGSALKSSALRLSCPGDIPFFSSVIAVIISCLFGRLISISKSLIASVIIASSSGAGLLSTSLKCSADLAFCSSSVVSSLPFLSFIGTSLVLWNLPHICLVILYMCWHVNVKNRNYNNLKIYNNMFIPVILKNNNLHNTTYKYSADL